MPANLHTAAICAGFRSASSIADGVRLGEVPARNSSSIFFMMAGVAEPPNLPLNFTPFQFQGLWLEVIITPPAALCCFTANDTAGVGNASLESWTGIPAWASTSAATRAALRDANRVS